MALHHLSYLLLTETEVLNGPHVTELVHTEVCVAPALSYRGRGAAYTVLYLCFRLRQGHSRGREGERGVKIPVHCALSVLQIETGPFGGRKRRVKLAQRLPTLCSICASDCILGERRERKGLKQQEAALLVF